MKNDEAYWHNKHPLVDQVYEGRPLPNGKPYEIDIRHFIWPDDYGLKALIWQEHLCCDSNDESALAAQQYVCENIKYVSDEKLGHSEYWLFPMECLEMGSGDCEDQAILIASLLLNCLEPEHYWRVRVCAGWVQDAPTAPQGGHGYCVWNRCLDNEWVVLDGCYYADPGVAVSRKPLHKNNHYYKDIWFSFSNKFSWSHKSLKLKGRVKKYDITHKAELGV